jgi:phosphoenolpyruvate carboxylase
LEEQCDQQVRVRIIVIAGVGSTPARGTFVDQLNKNTNSGFEVGTSTLAAVSK